MRMSFQLLVTILLVSCCNPLHSDEDTPGEAQFLNPNPKAMVEAIAKKLEETHVTVNKGEPSLEELAARVVRLPPYHCWFIVLKQPPKDDPTGSRAWIPNATPEAREARFRWLIIQQLKKDKDFPEKLARAKEKAKALFKERFPHPQRGQGKYRMEIEKACINAECGISWWMTSVDLNPDIIID